MFKSLPFFPSHAGSVEVQCGVCELELPLELVDPYGIFNEERSVWYRGSEEEFEVQLTLLCHGSPMHSVPVRTRAAASYDERRGAMVWGELVRFPVKVRELSLDARIAVQVVGESGLGAASASLALFDNKGVLKQGLLKIALHDERIGDDRVCREAAVRAARNGVLGGGRGGFVDALRGDDEYEVKFAATDYLFRADKLELTLRDRQRMAAEASVPDQSPNDKSASLSSQGSSPVPSKQQRLAAASRPPSTSAVAWLDELSLRRVRDSRLALGDREGWFKAPYTSSAERSMLRRAFLVIDLPTFEHPVLWEEKVYAGAPRVDPASSSLGGIIVEANKPAPAKRKSKKEKEPVSWMQDDITVVVDYEDGVVSNPIEDKYRALARETTRALVDRDLKPNVDEARALAYIIASPSDEIAPADRELVWKFRYTLKGNATALPKFLLSVDWRVEAEVTQVRELLDEWRDRTPIDIAHALKLLGPEKAFQHDVVRSFAVDALRSATDEELIAYLLQLVQALRYSEAARFKKLAATAADDPFFDAAAAKKDGIDATLDDDRRGDDDDDSPLAAFLNARACASLAVANFMWWYLKVGAEDTTDEAANYAYHLFRNKFTEDLYERAPETYATLRAQEQLVASVLSAQARARHEKGRKDHKQERLRGMLADLEIPRLVCDKGVPMPLDPTFRIDGLHEPASTAKMYRSAMYPALVAFQRRPELVIVEPPAPVRDAVTEEPPRRLFAARRRRRTDDEPSATKSFLDGVVGSIATAAFGGGKESTHDAQSQDSESVASEDSDARSSQPVQPLAPYRVIVKNGDDLRQDQLVLQFVVLMDLLLKRVNLDLKLTCFRALATGANSGLIEFVEDSYAISAILADHHGSIVEYLKVHNPDPKEPDGFSSQARDNFTRSCAGYCVITYLLGVGDRHLDNIMVTKSGCLFHIDFGFILGKDPKPYPPPFRLTKEMAEAMGYPDDPNYQKFKTKCCQAYVTLRKHATLLLNLMSLMKDAGIEHLSEERALHKFQDRFRLDLGDEDAERYFLALINESLNALVPVVLERFHKIAVWLK